MSTYYKKITPGVKTEHYAFFSGVSVCIVETEKYEQFVNATRTEAQLLSAGFSEISESDYNTYVDNPESFMRVGNHPPAKPPGS